MEEKKHTHIRNNLSKAERIAFENLSKDESIIIKPADKGGEIVIMDRDDYIAEVRQQLADSSSYSKIRSVPTSHIRSLILVVLREALNFGIIENGLFSYLQVAYPRVPVFYTLPKIHKDLPPPPEDPLSVEMEESLSL